MPHATHQNVAILIIGNEVLSGRTREANAWFAAGEMFKAGCTLAEVAIVPDKHEQIVSSLHRLAHDYDAVITSGGIGPTHDDITMQCVADCCAVPLLEHAETVALMADYYGEAAFNDGRRRMARLPQGSKPIICAQSIAPGAHIQNIYVFAGVPHIFSSQLMAVIADFQGEHGFIRHEIDVALAESSFAAALDRIQQQFPQLDIGSYPARCGNKPCGKICISGLDAEHIKQAEHAITMMLKDKINP